MPAEPASAWLSLVSSEQSLVWVWVFLCSPSTRMPWNIMFLSSWAVRPKKGYIPTALTRPAAVPSPDVSPQLPHYTWATVVAHLPESVYNPVMHRDSHRWVGFRQWQAYRVLTKHTCPLHFFVFMCDMRWKNFWNKNYAQTRETLWMSE